MKPPFPEPSIVKMLRRGVVIPAHPLALNSQRKLDEQRQRALTRYYCTAGAGGVAVAVHTTQFEIRDKKVDLLQPVLELASQTVDEVAAKSGKEFIKIAGIIGKTEQAVKEAKLAAGLGYHLGLVSLGAWREGNNAQLLAHLRAISEIIPLFGFYLQPAVGGRVLDYRFWRRAVEIENLLAIKIAPFNRYYTLDVARAVWESGRTNEITLYTGNDDHIIFDLLSEFRFDQNPAKPAVTIAGGLLGHWAVWTQKAEQQLEEIKKMKQSGAPIFGEITILANQVTDANAAIFDPVHRYAGCIPGIHEVLRRQGLLENRHTLNPQETLSPGQMAEIDRVYNDYPHLHDDDFVRRHLDEWLK